MTCKMYFKKLECGPMPNLMAVQPNTGGALREFPNSITCTTPESLADTAAGVPCSNAANIGERKTWTQSEFCTWRNSARGQKPPKMYI